VYLQLRGLPVVTDEVLEIARDVDTTLINTLVEEAAEHHVIAVGRFDPASRAAPGAMQEVVLLPTTSTSSTSTPAPRSSDRTRRVGSNGR